MKHRGKLNNFLNFLSYHSMCQLGINSLSTTRYMCFPILGMLTNLGVKPIPFFHIRPHIPHNFLMICLLIKGISLSNKYFVFPFYLKPYIWQCASFYLPLETFFPMGVWKPIFLGTFLLHHSFSFWCLPWVGWAYHF